MLDRRSECPLLKWNCFAYLPLSSFIRMFTYWECTYLLYLHFLKEFELPSFHPSLLSRPYIPLFYWHLTNQRHLIQSRPLPTSRIHMTWVTMSCRFLLCSIWWFWTLIQFLFQHLSGPYVTGLTAHLCNAPHFPQCCPINFLTWPLYFTISLLKAPPSFFITCWISANF